MSAFRNEFIHMGKKNSTVRVHVHVPVHILEHTADKGTYVLVTYVPLT